MSDQLKIPREFPITVFQDLGKFNDVISKARVRVFYKGLNRNGTYITEEFAEDLIKTIDYSPIKGIYDDESKDFTDHGTERNQGRAYGVVPKENNFAWEKHKDEDGVEREYACFDVYLWTGIYEEAKEIPGKSQSMELYEPSILGEWVKVGSQRVFKFKQGSFLGLQALGDNVEPCFEGAAFFTVYNSLKQMIEQINEFQLGSQQTGGKDIMPELVFKLSLEQKRDQICNALNQDGSFRLWPVATYDEYVVAFDYEVSKYFKIGYTLGENDSIVLAAEKTEVFAEFITGSERTALDALRTVNGGTYEAIDTNYTTLQTDKTNLEAKVSEFDQKIVDKDTEISTLSTEKETLSASLNTANTRVGELEAEVQTLGAYKLGVETVEKEAILDKYAEQLSEEILTPYKEKLGEYTAIALDKELSYELVKSNPTIFTKSNPQFVPKDNVPKNGITALLDQYKK